MNDKQRQRRVAYDARNAQPEKDAMSQVICQRFISQPAYQQAQTIMWYMHCRSEVRTLNAVKAQLKSSKSIVIPFCTKDNTGQNQLGLWLLEDLGELEPATWGILEPPRSRWLEQAKNISPDQLDLIMVPGVAFDRNGGRLGNGAGYYDRLLHQVRSDTILSAVCFESQMFEQVIVEPHDVQMDVIITEKSIYQCC